MKPKATWKPPCVKCKKVIGYEAPDGWYVGTAECDGCKIRRRSANA